MQKPPTYFEGYRKQALVRDKQGPPWDIQVPYQISARLLVVDDWQPLTVKQEEARVDSKNGYQNYIQARKRDSVTWGEEAAHNIIGNEQTKRTEPQLSSKMSWTQQPTSHRVRKTI